MQIIPTDKGLQSEMMTNAVKGALAGAFAVWAMDKLDWFIFNHEDPAARRRTEHVRPGGLDPAHVVANRVANTFGTELTPKQPHPAGIAIHYGLGIGPAAIYGAFRDRLPVSQPGQDHLYGLGLGLGLFAIQDEGLNRAMGLSADPRRYPWQAHFRGFVAHVAYGVVTNIMLNLLKAPRPRPKTGHSSQAQHRPHASVDTAPERTPGTLITTPEESRPMLH